MWRNIIGQSIFQIALLSFLLYGVDSNQNLLIFPSIHSGKVAFDNGLASTHYTIIFNVFVFCQVFNEINSRKLTDWNIFENFFSNPLFSIILLFIVSVQTIIVEFGGNAIKTEPLSWDEWLLCIGLALLTIPIGFLIRLIKVPLEDWEKEVAVRY